MACLAVLRSRGPLEWVTERVSVCPSFNSTEASAEQSRSLQQSLNNTARRHWGRSQLQKVFNQIDQMCCKVNCHIETLSQLHVNEICSWNALSLFTMCCSACIAEASFSSMHAGDMVVKVSFSVPYRCEFGQNLSLIGSSSALGEWDLQSCTNMHWSDGDIWRAELNLPARCLSAMWLIGVLISCIHFIDLALVVYDAAMQWQWLTLDLVTFAGKKQNALLPKAMTYQFATL